MQGKRRGGSAGVGNNGFRKGSNVGVKQEHNKSNSGGKDSRARGRGAKEPQGGKRPLETKESVAVGVTETKEEQVLQNSKEREGSPLEKRITETTEGGASVMGNLEEEAVRSSREQCPEIPLNPSASLDSPALPMKAVASVEGVRDMENKVPAQTKRRVVIEIVDEEGGEVESGTGGNEAEDASFENLERLVRREVELSEGFSKKLCRCVKSGFFPPTLGKRQPEH